MSIYLWIEYTDISYRRNAKPETETVEFADRESMRRAIKGIGYESMVAYEDGEEILYTEKVVNRLGSQHIFVIEIENGKHYEISTPSKYIDEDATGDDWETLCENAYLARAYEIGMID